MATPDLEIQIDRLRRIIRLAGINYSFDFFIEMSSSPIGARFEIIGREDGTVHLRSLGRDPE